MKATENKTMVYLYVRGQRNRFGEDSIKFVEVFSTYEEAKSYQAVWEKKDVEDGVEYRNFINQPVYQFHFKGETTDELRHETFVGKNELIVDYYTITAKNV